MFMSKASELLAQSSSFQLQLARTLERFKAVWTLAQPLRPVRMVDNLSIGELMKVSILAVTVQTEGQARNGAVRPLDAKPVRFGVGQSAKTQFGSQADPGWNLEFNASSIRVIFILGEEETNTTADYG